MNKVNRYVIEKLTMFAHYHDSNSVTFCVVTLSLRWGDVTRGASETREKEEMEEEDKE